MIQANFHENEGVFKININGHSGVAEQGKDLICAGVSVLTLTLIQALKTMEQQGFFEKEVDADIKDGFTKIECKPKADSYSVVLNTFLTIRTGFEILQRMFGQYIKVTDVGNAINA